MKMHFARCKIARCKILYKINVTYLCDKWRLYKNKIL